MDIDTLIIHAGQLVTCASGGMPKRGKQMCDVGIISDGAVAIHRGKIVDVGKTTLLRDMYQPTQTINARHRTVCPGFVDCHTHVVYAGNRLNEFEQRIGGKPYMQILAEGGGILSTMRATRKATPADLMRQATMYLNMMLRHGTTTVEIKTGYGLDIQSEIKLLSAITTLDLHHPMHIYPTFLGAHAVPPEFSDATMYADYILGEMLPAIDAVYRASHFPRNKIPLGMDIFCEKGVFDLDTSKRLLVNAKENYGMAIKAHVDEFVNLGGVPMAIGLGALSVDHLDVTPESELRMLAQSNTVGVFLPAVNFNLGATHYDNARALIDMGGVVALSTDINPGSAPTPSLPMVMAIACRYQKLLPAEALNAITINAACALGAERIIGTIEIGKYANLVITDTDDYRALAYEFGADLVNMTIIKGGVVWSRLS